MLLTAVLIGLGGWVISQWPVTPTPGVQQPVATTATDEKALRGQFERAVLLLQRNQFQQAAIEFNSIIDEHPDMPDAYVNQGFALLGLEHADTAAEYFYRAIELRPFQANAYYGLALVAEKKNDLESASGAMKSFIHLASEDDPYLPKARAALWEWETAIKPGDDGVEEAESAAHSD